MKKMLLLCLSFILLMSMAGCKGKDDSEDNGNSQTPTVIPAKTYISCSIKFSNDPNGEDLIESMQFEINKDVYAIIEFDFYNLDSVDDVVAFKIDLTPGIDTYSVYDYTMGPQEPTKVDTEAQTVNEDGIIKTIEISGMRFTLKAENAKKHYKYVFKIQASRVCDSCSLKATFIPEDGNFNEGKNKSFPSNYSFVDNSESNEGDE